MEKSGFRELRMKEEKMKEKNKQCYKMIYNFNNPIELICFVSSVLYIIGIILYNFINYNKGKTINIFDMVINITMSWLFGPIALLLLITIGPILIFDKYGNVRKKD